MYYSLLILFIWTSARALDTAKNSTANNGSIVISETEDKEKLLLNTTEISQVNSSVPLSTSISDLSSTTTKYVSEESPSKNITDITPKKLTETSSRESEMTHNSSKTSEMVITEGGNSVSTLGSSVTNFQSSHETTGNRILTEGGDQGIISDKVDSVYSKPNVTPILSKGENISKSQDVGVSSMNKSKITARKGVNDPKPTNSVPSDHNAQLSRTRLVTHTPIIILKDEKALKTINTNISHVRMAKPEVTDDRNESNVNGIKKIDYIVPIVCTAFSVPLLVVLAIYLYKKGSDFWERRHYNRMDFLIEGIYNE